MYLRFVLGIILITSIMLECIICRVKKLKGLQGLLWIVISFAFGFFLSSFFTYRINRIDRLIKIAIFVFMMGITELVLFFGVSRIKWRLKWFQCAFYPLLFAIGVIASFIAYGEKPSDYKGDLYSLSLVDISASNAILLFGQNLTKYKNKVRHYSTK